MATDINFSDHNKVLVMISEAQDANTDMRQSVRDAKLFLNKRDGQWDPYAWQKLEGRFRGTFDMCTPIVDQISGEVDQSDFSLSVSPSGGDSSIDVAKTYDGLIRNIRNVSNADEVFNNASRSNVIGGFDAVEVVQEFIDGDSFDQDLIIKKIPNAVDSVWFDLGSVEQDASDARWCVKLITIPTAEYNELYPDGSGQSIGDDRRSEAFFNKAESVTVGHLYYKKKVDIDLVEMTNGAIYREDEDFESVKDELANPVDGSQPITIATDKDGNERRRTRKSWRVHLRMFDGGDWLGADEETVFDDLPIIPIYGNFDVFENKLIYFGKIEKLYDQQRVLNYAMSRDIEDGALSPRKKYWATPEQIEGHEATIQSLNTNNDPLQQYNHTEGMPPPFMQGGVEASQGLQTTIANTQQMISASANSFNALQGNANPNQSGVAGGQQIEQGNIGSIKWFKALQVMVCQVGKVLIHAMPRVYDSKRQVRILEEDGTSSMVTLHDNILDFDNLGPQGEPTNVELNDLSQGDYDVVCDYGPAFNSQQKETAQAFIDMAQLNPEVAQRGMDIWLKNLAIPGMDMMAERFRESLLQQDAIPEKQLTDEERQLRQQQQEAAAQQPPQEDPNLLIAQAEMGKAQAEQTNAQTKQSEAQFNAQVKSAEVQLGQSKVDLDNKKLEFEVQKFLKGQSDKFNVDAANIQQGKRKLDLQAQQMQIDATFKAQAAQQQQINDAINNLKTIQDASGDATIIGPGLIDNMKTQSDIVSEAQGGSTLDVDLIVDDES